MKRVAIYLSITLLMTVSAFTACSGAGGGGGTGDNQNGPSGVATPDRSLTLVSSDNLLQMVIPAGAVSSDVNVEITQGAEAGSYTLLPSGQVFNQPVTVTYTGSATAAATAFGIDVSELSPDGFKLFHSGSSKLELVESTSSIEGDTLTIAAEISHFSGLAFIAMLTSVTVGGTISAPVGATVSKTLAMATDFRDVGLVIIRITGLEIVNVTGPITLDTPAGTLDDAELRADINNPGDNVKRISRPFSISCTGDGVGKYTLNFNLDIAASVLITTNFGKRLLEEFGQGPFLFSEVFHATRIHTMNCGDISVDDGDEEGEQYDNDSDPTKDDAGIAVCELIPGKDDCQTRTDCEWYVNAPSFTKEFCKSKGACTEHNAADCTKLDTGASSCVLAPPVDGSSTVKSCRDADSKDFTKGSNPTCKEMGFDSTNAGCTRNDKHTTEAACVAHTMYRWLLLPAGTCLYQKSSNLSEEDCNNQSPDRNLAWNGASCAAAQCSDYKTALECSKNISRGTRECWWPKGGTSCVAAPDCAADGDPAACCRTLENASVRLCGDASYSGCKMTTIGCLTD